MFQKEKDYIGITLGEESVKLAHFKVGTSGQKVIGISKKDVRDSPEEDLPKIIRSAMGELNVKKAQAYCTIPASLVTTKNIEIPSMDTEEIKSIIDLQAGRHTPYSREEILLDYINIGVFQRNYTKILLIIVNRDIIKKQMDIFQSAGIQVDKVLFVPEAIARFYARVLEIKETDTPLGILDISGFMTSFAVEFNRTVATCRSIPLGLSHLIKDGPNAQNKLLDEIVQSVEAYQSEDISQIPETYILTGDDTKIKELQPFLQEKLKANVKIVSYLDHIQADQDTMMKLVSTYNDDSFFEIISPISMLDEIKVSLIPDEVKVQRAIEARGREVIKSGVYGIVLLICVCAVFFARIYFKDVYLDKVKEEYLTKRKQVIDLDRISQKTQIVKEFVNSRMVSLEVLDELYRLIPDEIYLQNIFLEENGVINIQGISDSMSIVFNFVSALDKSDYFKKVNPKSTTDTKDRGKDVAAFTIEFMLESVDESQIKTEEVVEEVAEGEAPT